MNMSEFEITTITQETYINKLLMIKVYKILVHLNVVAYQVTNIVVQVEDSLGESAYVGKECANDMFAKVVDVKDSIVALSSKDATSSLGLVRCHQIFM